MFLVINSAIAIGLISLGIINLRRDTRKLVNYLFFALTMSSAALAFTYGLTVSGLNIKNMLFVDRLTVLFSSMTLASIVAFVYVFIFKPQNYVWQKLTLILAPLTINGIVGVFTDWFIKSIEISGNIVKENTGDFYPIRVAMLAIYIIALIVLLVVGYNRRTKREYAKREIIVIATGTVASVVVAFVFSLILPYFFKIYTLNYYGTTGGALIFVISMFYVLVTTRIMNIGSLIIRVLYWVSVFIMVLVPLMLGIFFLNKIWQTWDFGLKIVFHIIIFFAFYLYLYNIIRLTDRFFHPRKDKFNLLLEEFEHNSLLFKNTNTLAQAVDTVITKALNPTSIVFFDKEPDKLVDILNPKKYIKINKELVHFLEKNPQLIESENLFTVDKYREINSMALKYFEHNKANIIIPLVFDKSLVGLIHIGSKHYKKHYTYDEIDFLSRLQCLLSVAMNNSMIYNKLENIVEIKTDELSKQNLALEYALQTNERDMQIFRSLHEFSQALLSTKYYSIADFHKALVDIFPGFINIKLTVVYEFNSETKQFVFCNANRISNEDLEFPPNSKLAKKDIFSQVYISKKSHIIYNIKSTKKYNKQHLSKINVKNSIICIPLMLKGDVHSILSFIDKIDSSNYDKYDFYYVNTLSHILNLSLENVNTFEERIVSERLASIGQMAANIVHDIKNPIASIKGFAECLQSPEFGTDDRTAFVDIIIDESDRLLELASQVLEFSRGEINVNKVKINLGDFLDEIFKYLHGLFRVKNIHFELSTDYRGTICIDTQKIKRVIYNIAQNAYEVMNDNANFTIRIIKKAQYIIITLADTGPGIPVDVQDKLFTAYVTQGKNTGTGLGMAIAKSFAEAHGGKIYFETKVSKGTTFYVEIPLK